MSSATLANPQIYQGVPLEFDKPCIRLLEVLPTPPNSVFSSGIQCSLHVFRSDACPEYTALSYAWGSKKWARNITVNGTSTKVQRNLYHFLRQIRDDRRHLQRYIWIDAICINQGNNAERSHQVSMMDRIYAQAASVTVWLGDGIYTTPNILSKIASYSQHTDAELVTAIEAFDTAYALADLYGRKYWDRVWVVQELMLGHNIYVRYGVSLISWAQFAFFHQRLARISTLSSLSNVLHSDTEGPGLFIKNKLAWDAQPAPRSFSIPHIVQQFMHLKCHDPHDRIYGFRSLLHDPTTMYVDYNNPPSTFFVQVLTQLPTDTDIDTVSNLGRALELRPDDPRFIVATRSRYPNTAPVYHYSLKSALRDLYRSVRHREYSRRYPLMAKAKQGLQIPVNLLLPRNMFHPIRTAKEEIKKLTERPMHSLFCESRAVGGLLGRMMAAYLTSSRYEAKVRK